MGIENIRWWQWPFIGLFLGCCLWFVNSGPAEPVNDTTVEQRGLEQAILHPPRGPDHVPVVKNLVIYPVVESPSTHAKVIVIRFDKLVPKPGGGPTEFTYEHCWAHTPVPYSPYVLQPVFEATDTDLVRQFQAKRASPDYLPPGIWKRYAAKPTDGVMSICRKVYGTDTADGETLLKVTNRALVKDAVRLRAGQAIYVPWPPQSGKTVLDWLNDAKAQFPWVSYRFAWWAVPRNCMLLWIGGTFLVVGVIWPVVNESLMRVGLGPQRKPRERRVSLASSKSSPSPEPAVAAGMTEDDEAKLRALEESLEASLKAGATAEPAVEEEEEEAPVAVVALSNKPADPAPALSTGATELDVEFGGEFYPVVKSYHPHVSETPADGAKTSTGTPDDPTVAGPRP